MTRTASTITRRLALAAIAPLLVVGCDMADQATPYDIFELGVNDPEVALPSGWSPVSEGATVAVRLGTQGSLMVVGAVRTDRVPVGEKVTIIASVEDAETGYQHAKIKFRRALVDGGDGYAYLGDVYLILGKPGGETDWSGREALLSISIESLEGTYEDTCVVRPTLTTP
jgi:hypothetical protein